MSVFSAFVGESAEDDVIGMDSTYSYGVDARNAKGWSEMYGIERAFRKALGATGTQFTCNGGDERVRLACEKVGRTLSAMQFHGSYTFTVRSGMGNVVYTWSC